MTSIRRLPPSGSRKSPASARPPEDPNTRLHFALQSALENAIRDPERRARLSQAHFECIADFIRDFAGPRK